MLDPKGDPLPDNAWTQFVAIQATIIERLENGFRSAGVPQSMGLSLVAYTLLVRAVTYPLVRGQIETTAKMQVLAPRVKELQEKFKDDEERKQQEVGLLYMDLNVDPIGMLIPVFLQLPIYWGLYRAVRRLAIVDYAPLRDRFLWIPSLFGPNFKADPSLDWVTQWKGPLVELHPTIGWEAFGWYSILPLLVFLAYKEVLSDATKDPKSPKILQAFPFFLLFITTELPQGLGVYLATNIASSVALTTYLKQQITSGIPGYAEFKETGKWPPGVDPEAAFRKAFVPEDQFGDPASVPEAIFAGRADVVPKLIEGNPRRIDEFDDKGIPASCYCLVLEKEELLERLFELGADVLVKDKVGNTLFHYCGGYGAPNMVQFLLDRGAQSILNATNDEGQTALDVGRMNLAQEKIADRCRETIDLMKEAGAVGKCTTDADEPVYEAKRVEIREKKEKDAQVAAAREALAALAQAAQSKKPKSAPKPVAAEDEHAKAAAAVSEEGAPEEPEEVPQIAAALGRVKKLDAEDLRRRLGKDMSDEQLEKLAARLENMSPSDLAKFAAATGKKNGEEENDAPSDNEAPPQKAPEEKKSKESIIVD